MGIRIMTTANNHSMDAGPEGVFMTNRFLDEAGIAHAGTGKNLTEARRPAIATT
jgi:poly-gamma-glutamate capsule biosynthesis protein CapA/YwtB (metallophosphatase superfamily)